MINRSRIKIIVVVVFLAGLSIALYLRRPKSGGYPGWDKGLASNSERNFYYQRMNRIIEDWQQTIRTAERNNDGRLKDSYNTYLVIDLDKKALWIEENGQIIDDEYCEFPPETECKFFHYTAQGNVEYSGQMVLKMRGYYPDQMTPEQIFLLYTGDGGYLSFHFSSHGRGGGYGSGTINKPSFTFPSSSANANNLYGSILVTGDEYKKYLDSQSKVKNSLAEDENKKAWNKIEKYLYIEIERQMRTLGLNLGDVSVEPGPDFSTAHADIISGQKVSIIRRILGGSHPVETYLKIDYLGNDIWYAKSDINPKLPSMTRHYGQELEFLISPEIDITDSQRNDLLKKGRDLQRTSAIPESKWSVTLSSGMTVEFIGICDNPSYGKQWWGPDGNSIDFVPYINTALYDKPGDSRKIYEFAWSIKNMPQNTAQRFSFEGSNGSYYYAIYDRYGNHIIESDLQAEGFSFDVSRQTTTFKMSFGINNWKTALKIEDEAGEIKFKDKQQIILNPPVIENGQIVIRCYEEFENRMSEYRTNFGLIYYEDMESKTISLGRYETDVTDNQETGLTEHKYIINNLNLNQIEGVCFRYQSYSFVIFKNISLVPGQNQGFEIEVHEADDK